MANSFKKGCPNDHYSFTIPSHISDTSSPPPHWVYKSHFLAKNFPLQEILLNIQWTRDIDLMETNKEFNKKY